MTEGNGSTAALPLRLTCDSAALVGNWRWLAARSPGACGAAVKADGYGLGAAAVVKALAEAGCRDFFVATWAEAVELVDVAPPGSLVVLHGIRAEDVGTARQGFARPVLNTAAQVMRWREIADGRPCDVMVDTGMNRLGLSAPEVRSALMDGLAIDTLMSHLACADEPESPMNERQRAAFAALADTVPARRRSLANSAGICLGAVYGFDLTRPGIALYGGRVHPACEGTIMPVARIEAQVLQRRRVEAGAAIGYGATLTVTRDTEVAILNIGYADGYPRLLSGVGRVFAGDHPCPVAGRISMDLTAVIVDGVDVAEGDWLTIDHDLPHAAAQTGLSQYELLTGLGDRYQRRWT